MRSFDYSWIGKTSWDTDILNLVEKIHVYEQLPDRLCHDSVLPVSLVETAVCQSTESSNRIEGIVTTDSRMKVLLQGDAEPVNLEEEEIMGYWDVLNTINENYAYIPVRRSYILQLHRDLLKRTSLSFGGHFKNVQNYIKGTRPDGTTVTLFTPVAPYETPEAIDRLCAAYEQAVANDSIDPLLLIPAFIIDFLCIHPFNDGNGRMSRLLTLLLLYQNGYSIGKYISIEKQIEDTKESYYAALAASDLNWQDEKNDYIPFIRYMLEVIVACYEKLG